MELADGSRKRLEQTGSLWLGVVLVVLLVGIVNYFGWKYHERFDWTASRLYTLSEKTESVLAALDRDVEAVVLMDAGDELYDPVRELLARYEAASRRFRVRMVDPQKSLIEAQGVIDEFELNQLNVVVFDVGGDRRVVEAVDLADYDYSGMQMGQGPTMSAFKGESAFTGALLELVEQTKPRILFTTGHGEMQLDDFSQRGLSSLRELMGRDNAELEEWASLGQPAVPEGTDLLVIAGPTSTFVEPEIAVLRDYLDGGGRLLVMLDPTLAPDGGLVATGLEGLLADYGARVGDDIVIDPANPLPFFGAETLFASSYGDHLITRSLRQRQLPVIVPLARSVTRAEGVDGLEITELVRTSSEGWGETDLVNLDAVEQGDADLAGPVPLGVAVELAAAEPEAAEEPAAEAAEGAPVEAADGPSTEDEATAGAAQPAVQPRSFRMVVLGDSDLASNGQLQNVPNVTLVANVLNWLVERDALVGIPPKTPEQVRLSLSQGELSGITWLVMAVLPGLALAAGAVVYRRRRR